MAVFFWSEAAPWFRSSTVVLVQLLRDMTFQADFKPLNKFQENAASFFLVSHCCYTNYYYSTSLTSDLAYKPPNDFCLTEVIIETSW